MTVTLQEAYAIIDGALARSAEIGQPMNVAVVDAGGNLVSFARADGAWLGSIQIAQDKAWTSRAFDIATADLAEPSGPGGQFHGIATTNGGHVAIFAGGLPLKRDGVVVGAIGVSGGSGEQDADVARAGVAAFE